MVDPTGIFTTFAAHMGFVAMPDTGHKGPAARLWKRMQPAAHIGSMTSESDINTRPRLRAEEAVIGLIWAQGNSGVIGAGGTMPWHLPEDLAHFSDITKGHPVIMGRRTWESLPDSHRPLPGRTNIVISSNPDLPVPGAIRAANLGAALIEASLSGLGSQQIWIIGGGQLYREALDLADTVVITRVDIDSEGDTYAPELGAEWTREETLPLSGPATSRTGTRYSFERWTAG